MLQFDEFFPQILRKIVIANKTSFPHCAMPAVVIFCQNDFLIFFDLTKFLLYDLIQRLFRLDFATIKLPYKQGIVGVRENIVYSRQSFSL